MATNMPPHNPGEVIAAARHLIRHPGADLETLMRFVPGPDLPTGGRIVGLNGIKDAYDSGRGTFKIRATATVENVTPRRKGIVVTELPFTVGPEKVIAKIKDLVGAEEAPGHRGRLRTSRTGEHGRAWSSRSRTVSCPRRCWSSCTS